MINWKAIGAVVLFWTCLAGVIAVVRYIPDWAFFSCAIVVVSCCLYIGFTRILEHR